MAFDTLLELYMGHLPICMQTRMKLYIDMVSFICPGFVPYALSAINAILQHVFFCLNLLGGHSHHMDASIYGEYLPVAQNRNFL